MSLLTLDDRITIIQSHTLSLRRAAVAQNMDDLKKFFESIMLIAKEGMEIYTVEDAPDGSGNPTPV